MINLYAELKKQFHQKMNSFINKNCFFAFNDEQMQKGLKEFNVTLEESKLKFVRIPGRGFMLKDKVSEYKGLLKSRDEEIAQQIKLDETGDGFIYHMFVYELRDDEFSYHGDDSTAIAMCNLTREQIDESPALLNGLTKAKAYVNSLD